MKKEDVIGLRFGRLLVTSLSHRDNLGKRMMKCVCDCGNEKVVYIDSLRHGDSKSCGCLHREIATVVNTKHGQASIRSGKRTSEYNIWGKMIQRCNNPNGKCFHNYGGRGISVCSRWRNSYSSFISDMGYRPSNEHSIERINVNGNYEPGNCRWAIPHEQSRNKRNNRFFEFNGEKKILIDWAKVFGVNRTSIQGHLKRGKSFEQVAEHYFSKQSDS